MLTKFKHTTAQGTSIAYLDNKLQDKKVIVVLHGWGADKDNLKAVYGGLTDSYRIIALDLPGFGESSAPASTWGSEEYADEIYSFIISLGINRFSLIGHSFGGKIASIISYKYPHSIEKLVLIAANCLRNKHGVIWHCKVFSYKVAKNIIKSICRKEDVIEGFKDRFGSDDYKNSKELRDILVKNVNEDLTDMMKKITVPVFLFWGSKDDATPLWMAKRLHQLIPDSGLFIVKGAGHYPFLQDSRLQSIIKSFI